MEIEVHSWGPSGREEIIYLGKDGNWVFAKDYPEIKDIRPRFAARDFLMKKWIEKYRPPDEKC